MKNLIQKNNFHLDISQMKRVAIYEKAAQEAYAENTERARKSDSKVFEAWCDENQRISLPATVETLVDFIEAQSKLKKLATIKRYLSTISTSHNAAGIKPPVKDPIIGLALKRVSRKNGSGQKQADPFNWSDISIALESLDNSPRSILDKTLVCVSYDTLCRRSETVEIQIEDIEFFSDGSATVIITKSKTDQGKEGTIKYLSNTTVGYLKQWLEFSKITEGHLFRGLNRWEQLLDTPLTDKTLVRSLRRVAKKTGLDADKISGHSTRVGACQDLVAAGIDMPAIMQAGGWTNQERVALYSKKLQAKRGGMAQLSSIQRR